MRRMPWIVAVPALLLCSLVAQAEPVEKVFELVDEGDEGSTMVIKVEGINDIVADMWGTMTFMVDDAAGTWELTETDITIQDLLLGAVTELWFRYPYLLGPSAVIGEEGAATVTFDAESATCATCTDFAGQFHANTGQIGGVVTVNLLQTTVFDLTGVEGELDLRGLLQFQFQLIQLADVDVNIHAVQAVPEPGSAASAMAAMGALAHLARQRRG